MVRKTSLLAIAWIAVLYLQADWGRPVMDDVDGLYLHASQQMVRRGDFVTPYANGVRFLDKPPLLFWLAALSTRFLGEGEFPSRLPIVLSVVLTCALLLTSAARAGSEKGGLFAALAYGLSAGTFLFSRTAHIDFVLVFFWMLAFSSFLSWYEEGGTERILLVSASLAGALLSKGLIGLVIPGGGILVFLLAKKDLARLRPSVLLLSLVTILVLGAPWFVLVARRNPGFLWYFFVNEHVLRFFNRRQPVDYASTPVLEFWGLSLVWFLPWTFFLGGAFSIARRLEALPPHLSNLVRLHLSWALFALAFFTLSSRLDHYALSFFPPAAMLVGVGLALTEDGWIFERGSAALGLVGGLVGAACALLALAFWGGGPDALLGASERRLAGYQVDFGPLYNLPQSVRAELMPLLLGTGVVLFLGCTGAWLLSRAGRREAAVLALGAMMSAFCLLAARSLRACDDVVSSKRFGEALRSIERQGDQLVNVGDYETVNSVNFYASLPILLYRGRASVLEWGLSYPDAPRRLIDEGALQTLWRGPTRVFLLSPDGERPSLPPGRTREILHAGGRTLLSNEPAPGP